MSQRMRHMLGCSLAASLILGGSAMAGPRSAGGGTASKSTASTPSKPSSSGDTATPSRDSITAKMDPEQKSNIDTLTSQLTALQGNSDVTDDQKKQLTKDLQAAMEGAQKPSEESVSKLAGDMVDYTSDGKMTTKEIMAIQKDVKAVLDSANITDAEVEALKTDVKGIADSSNLTKEDVDSLVAEVEAIAKTAQANAQTADGAASSATSGTAKSAIKRR